MDAIAVTPMKNGRWAVSGVKESFPNRRKAIERAYAEAGRRKLFDEDGNQVTWTEVEVPVDLHRRDGSLYGNLASPPQGQGPAQRISLTPAGESNKAQAAGSDE